MKNHDEMYQSLLSRYEEYQEKKQGSVRTIKRFVPVLAGFSLCAILGFGYWNHSQKLPKIPTRSEVIHEQTTEDYDQTTTALKNELTAQISDQTKPGSVSAPFSDSETECMNQATETQAVVTDSSAATATELITTKQTDIQTTAPIVTESQLTTTSPKNNVTEPPDTEITTAIHSNDHTMSAPIIRLYRSAAVSETQYTEMIKDEVVRIETDFNPVMSNWSGIGILLEFDSKDYPITLSTNNGHFTEWNIETGMGTVTNVGTTYNIGNKGYVFWTPDQLDFTEGFESEILIMGNHNEQSVEMGKIVVNMSDQHTLYAVLKE